MEQNTEFINPFFAIPDMSENAKENKTESKPSRPISPISQKLSPLPKNPVVAMAYIPMQEINIVYEEEKGIDRGTIFPELDKPFEGRDQR